MRNRKKTEAIYNLTLKLREIVVFFFLNCIIDPLSITSLRFLILFLFSY